MGASMSVGDSSLGDGRFVRIKPLQDLEASDKFGWEEEMDCTCGQVGIIAGGYSDGTSIVSFGSDHPGRKSWRYRHSAFVVLDTDDVDEAVRSDLRRHVILRNNNVVRLVGPEDGETSEIEWTRNHTTHRHQYGLIGGGKPDMSQVVFATRDSVPKVLQCDDRWLVRVFDDELDKRVERRLKRALRYAKAMSDISDESDPMRANEMRSRETIQYLAYDSSTEDDEDGDGDDGVATSASRSTRPTAASRDGSSRKPPLDQVEALLPSLERKAKEIHDAFFA